MALFSRREKGGVPGGQPPAPAEETRPLVAHALRCRICASDQRLTRCWRRLGPQRRCGCCGQVFQDPKALYKQLQPCCPRCAEPLEQEGFDYGLCDGCGSKYEIMEGTKPGLLPNHQQREQMRTTGRIWTKHDEKK